MRSVDGVPIQREVEDLTLTGRVLCDLLGSGRARTGERYRSSGRSDLSRKTDAAQPRLRRLDADDAERGIHGERLHHQSHAASVEAPSDAPLPAREDVLDRRPK